MKNGVRVTGLGIALMGSAVNTMPGREGAIRTLKLGGLGGAIMLPSGTTAENVMRRIERLIGIRRRTWLEWKNGIVSLSGLEPTSNSGRDSGFEENHNRNSKGNGATKGNRGKRGTHSKTAEPNFRNNRVPLCEEVPGENFAYEGSGAVMKVGLDTLRMFRSNTAMSIRALVRDNVIGGPGSKMGVLKGKRLAGGLAIRTGTFDTGTTRGVRTLNKGTRIVWYLDPCMGRWMLEVSRESFSVRLRYLSLLN